MAAPEKTKFWQDYWIVTFEGIVVALFIATLSLIGVFRLLIIPVFLQLVVVALLVKYKTLKRNTEIAIETNIRAEKRTHGGSPEALYDRVESEYYQENKIDKKIRRYQA